MVLEKKNQSQGAALGNICHGVNIIHSEGKNNSAESADYAVFRFYAFNKIFNHQKPFILCVMAVLYIVFQKTATFNKRLIFKKGKLLAFKLVIV